MFLEEKSFTNTSLPQTEVYVLTRVFSQKNLCRVEGSSHTLGNTGGNNCKNNIDTVEPPGNSNSEGEGKRKTVRVIGVDCKIQSAMLKIYIY